LRLTSIANRYRVDPSPDPIAEASPEEPEASESLQ
jgi:hypothetical protein